MKTETQNKTRDDSKTEDRTNILPDGDSPKRFKFGLSAYSEQPSVQLKPNITSGSKYHDAKVEELKSHEDKGTWKIVPLKQGIKLVTSRWVATDKYGLDGKISRQGSFGSQRISAGRGS